MHRYHLQSVLLPQGWARDVSVSVSDEGIITDIDAAPVAGAPDSETVGGTQGAGTSASAGASAGAGAGAGVEHIDGIVVPGMANAHSHAFQRAMAGNTEYRLSARDSFWTWRQAMYGLANRIEADDLQTLAAQLFVEMLKSGYTSVAEFHYLHRQKDGAPYAEKNALWEAIGNAATISGIGLTFLPTLYQTSDFGGRPLKPEQARFASETDSFLRAVEDRVGAERRAQGARGTPQTQRTGAAFHSLRAVPLENLRAAALRLREIDAGMPVHIHVAEQVLEVKACVLQTGRRPI